MLEGGARAAPWMPGRSFGCFWESLILEEGSLTNSNRKSGTGLALSGGGFRATLFHLGGLWRLNELGLLKEIKEITSVSGGSIISAFLGLRWKKLQFSDNHVATNYKEEIVDPMRQFCSKTFDAGCVLKGLITPFRLSSDYLASMYKKHLFKNAGLQDFPSDEDGPRFTIYATSLQTGSSVRFSRPYLADYKVGLIRSPKIQLARAVAASSAFPPIFCPVILKLKPNDWEMTDGAFLYNNVKLKKRLYLADGGIYDNLGLERIWDNYETVFVSDAGAPFPVKANPVLYRFSLLSKTKRTLIIEGEQTRALRKRRLIDGFIDAIIKGTYWGVATHIQNYKLEENGFPGPMTKDSEVSKALACLRTRLNKFTDQEQGHLINWGYALADAALRRHFLNLAISPGQWPIPEYSL